MDHQPVYMDQFEDGNDTDERPDIDDMWAFAYTPHRRLIAAVGRLARVEQARLEREYRLQDGRRRRQNGPPGGYFP